MTGGSRGIGAVGLLTDVPNANVDLVLAVNVRPSTSLLRQRPYG